MFGSKRSAAIVGAVSAAILLGPAMAQDGSESTGQRTPASAQRFLKEQLSSNPTRLESWMYSPNWQTWNTANPVWRFTNADGQWQAYQLMSARVAGTNAPNDCTTTITLEDVRRQQGNSTGWGFMPGVPIVAAGPLDLGIEWSKVTKVAHGPSVPLMAGAAFPYAVSSLDPVSSRSVSRCLQQSWPSGWHLPWSFFEAPASQSPIPASKGA